MAIFLRRRLRCFYCNHQSDQRYTAGLLKWKCEYCDAFNYLDSKGDITDPPVHEVAAPVKDRYARNIRRSISPTIPPSKQSIFCQRCLNNQHLLVQSLANYLPPRADPRYNDFEANLPAYRKSLEERYPQVCEVCEPNVRDRIKQSGYMAKTDHLRRMREKTQSAMHQMKQSWQRMSVLTLVGCLIWYLSIVSQLLWHGLELASFVSQDSSELVDDTASLSECIFRAATSYQVNTRCAQSIYSPAGWILVLSLLTVWWNPIMRRRWIDRAIGLKEFYKLQLIVLLTRFAAWYTLGNARKLDLEPTFVQAVHAAMLALNIIVPIISYRTAYIARSPRVTFQDTLEPLVPEKQREATARSTAQRHTPPTSQTSSTPSPPPHFPDARQVQPSRQSEAPAYHPLTPPPEDGDEMDIDIPEKTYNLRPSIHRRIDHPQATGPSPFYGKIPAAPVSMERQLRNPPNKPSFQKTSPERQESFFQSMTKRGSPTSTGPSPNSGNLPSEIHMRPASFYTKQDRDAQETGLESWFTDFFSLGEPPGAHQTPNENKDGQPEVSSATILWYQLFSVLSLCLGAYGWTFASAYSSFSLPLYFLSIGISAIISGTRLRSILSNPVVNHSDLLLCLLELFGSAAIGYQIRQARLAGYRIDEELGSFPLWYFGFMIFQESSSFVSIYRRQAALLKPEPDPEYRLPQHQPPQSKGTAPPRDQRPLPSETSLAQCSSNQPYQPSLPSSAPSLSTISAQPPAPSRSVFEYHPNSSEQRGTRLQDQSTGQSPGSKGMSSLTLGLSDGTPVQRRAARPRGMARNPWEIGGL